MRIRISRPAPVADSRSSFASITKDPDQFKWNVAFFSLALLILIAAAFPDVVSGKSTFFYRDFGLFGYPLAFFHRTAFWHGEIPLWNPLNNCGLPFLAQWNTLTFYPGSLIYLLLPLPWSLSLFSLVHLWLAGMGMYFLARRWSDDYLASAVAGAGYALNGLMLHSLMWPNNIAALAWMPLVVLSMERGWIEGGAWVAKAAMLGALQMLTGAPEIILLTWIIVAALWAMEMHAWCLRLCARLFSTAILVAGISAVQLFPFIDLLHRSNRSSTFGDDTWSMPVWGWANFFVPLFHCSPSMVGVYFQELQQWTSSYYIGIGVTGFAMLALLGARNRRVLLLVIVAASGVLLALGSKSIFYVLVKAVFPQLGFVRYPIKFVVLTTFSVPLLAAFGVHELSSTGELRGAKRASLVLVWSALILTVCAILWSAHGHSVPNESWQVTLGSGLSRIALLTLAFGTLLLARKASLGRVKGLLEMVVVVLIALDGLTHAPRQNPTVPVRTLKPEAVHLRMMPRLGEGRAMISPRVHALMEYAANPDRVEYHLGQRRTLFENMNLIQGIPKVNGFYSLYLPEEKMLESVLYAPTNPFPSGLADFLGVVQVSSAHGLFEWTNRATSLPILTGGQRPEFAQGSTMVHELVNPRFSPGEIVYLPEPARAVIAATNKTRVAINSAIVTPSHIEATVIAEHPAMLVVAQSFYHCWKAFVDGRSVRLWPANYAFQALEVPSGTHTIRLQYHDSVFQTGAAVSAIALVLCLIMWGRTARDANDGADTS
jgi:hypothetical protein